MFCLIVLYSVTRLKLTVTAVANWAKSPVSTEDTIRSDSICSVKWAFSSVGNHPDISCCGKAILVLQPKTWHPQIDAPLITGNRTRDLYFDSYGYKLQLLPTELKARSTVQIESDLIFFSSVHWSFFSVGNSCNCQKTCHFNACFTLLWTTNSVSTLTLHMKSSRVCLYLSILITLMTYFHTHTQKHTHTGTHVWWAHNSNGDNQTQEPGWEGWRKVFR